MSGAGDLRCLVRLWKPGRTVDAGGAVQTSFEDIGADHAAVRLRRQTERASDARADGVATHEIRLRHREDIGGGWRIADEAKSYRVLAAADPDGRRRWTLCLCEEEEA
ncbi:phage head closure protein [Pannonibacter phragmitetus]|uniref:phage head closure protein n=1 Tax=Pannonibacter phragmitetus TaxID=121719 RepID=UPI003D2EE11D